MTNQYYSLWEKSWGGAQKFGPIHVHEQRLFHQILRSIEFDSVLEVGCGQGDKLNDIINKFKIKIFGGVDVAQNALQEAKKRMPNGEFCELDVQKSALKIKYDLVLCSDVLEHLLDDQSALNNIKKMTKKWVLLSTLEGQMRPFEKTIGHLRNYQPGELRRKCETAGFRVEEVINWGYPFYSPWYRDICNVKGVQEFSTGQYGVFKKLICKILYVLFFLNSKKKGDLIIILASVPD